MRRCIVVMVHTFLRWVDGGHRTKRAFSLVVVNPDFDLVRGVGRDALVLEDVSGGIRGRDSSLHPALRPEWAESHHVAKARTALQLLGNGLRRNESEEWLKMTDLKDINTYKKCSYAQIRAHKEEKCWGRYCTCKPCMNLSLCLLKSFYTEEKWNGTIQTEL